MKISEVQIKLIGETRLKAFCQFVIDGSFVIKDLKIIEGTKGLFVAMPCRRITDVCPYCPSTNHLKARYCNECGGSLDPFRYRDKVENTSVERSHIFADVFHPIKKDARIWLEDLILSAYHTQLAKEKDNGANKTGDSGPDPNSQPAL